MILTTKARYAVMAALEVASSGKDNPISLLTISNRQEISLSYLEQIFAHLRKANLVSSIRGPGGGYVLTQNGQDITIAQIIKAIGEPIKITRCSGKANCSSNKTKCQTHHLWQGLEGQIFDYLNSISLNDICK